MKNDEVWFGNNGCSVLSSFQNKVINYNTFYFQTTKLHMSKKEDITMTWHLVGLNYLKTRVWSEWRVENDMHLSYEYCSRLWIVRKPSKFCWNTRQLCMSRFESKHWFKQSACCQQSWGVDATSFAACARVTTAIYVVVVWTRACTTHTTTKVLTARDVMEVERIRKVTSHRLHVMIARERTAHHARRSWVVWRRKSWSVSKRSKSDRNQLVLVSWDGLTKDLERSKK